MDDKMEVIATVADGSEAKRFINIVFSEKPLGCCWCGGVRKAQIYQTGEKVAVKAVNLFPKSVELNYLKTLKHCNIVKMLYHFRKSNGAQELEYIVMELMPQSLRDMYRKPSKLPLLEIKLYMYQLLRGVAYMHNQGICHRDIKPANILIAQPTCVLKLCDFGLSIDLGLKGLNSTLEGSRDYHAPELLIGYGDYTNSVDVWAIGCIFVEILKGLKKLFKRQTTSDEQLKEMVYVFGTPTQEHFPDVKSYLFYDVLPMREAKPWSDILEYGVQSDDAISLCSGLLSYQPSSRLLPREALAHEFFDELRSHKTKCFVNGNPFPPLFNFQHGELSFSSRSLLFLLTGN